MFWILITLINIIVKSVINVVLLKQSGFDTAQPDVTLSGVEG